MKPRYLIKEKTAFIILVMLLAIPLLYLPFQKQKTEKESTEKEVNLLKINNQLDSLISIQAEIRRYDDLNQTDSIINSCDCLPDLENGISGSTVPIDFPKLVEEIEYDNLEQLQKREQMLTKSIDSLQQSIVFSTQQMNRYETIYDSISPKFSISQRSNIQDRVDSLHSEVINLLDNHITHLQQDEFRINFFIYYIRFLYVVLFILFPVRWTLIYFYNNK